MTIALRHGIFSNFKRKNCLKDYYHFQIHLRYCLLVVVALYILKSLKIITKYYGLHCCYCCLKMCTYTASCYTYIAFFLAGKKFDIYRPVVFRPA